MLRSIVASFALVVTTLAFADVAVQQANEDFDHYRERLRQHFYANKVWVDEQYKDREVEAVLPFEYRPNAAMCEGKPKVGVLMFHGLSDSPFTLRDPARAIAEGSCVWTRVMLLPRHGSAAEDLIGVSRNAWRESVAQAVKSFSEGVDYLYLGGFSTGGALVTEYAWTHPEEISGLVLFAPLFKINSSIDWLAPWLAPIIDWLDYNEPDDYGKYAAIPVPAIAEAYKLASEVRELVADTPARFPVLVALAEEDATVDSSVTVELFKRSMQLQEGSRLVLYSTTRKSSSADQVAVINTILPEQRIYGMSHMSVHGSPNNPYYGKAGSYRNCGWYFGDSELYDECRTSKSNWFGEQGDELAQRSVSAARLSWNPFFVELMGQVKVFLDEQARH